MTYARIAAATLMALASAAPALAADRAVSAITVEYGDLDLSTSAGVNALRHRLVMASHGVCGESDPRQMGSAADMQACREASLQDALRDLRRVVASAQAKPGTALASNAPN